MSEDRPVWDAARVTFRPLERADFPLMLRWHNTPHVREWWQLDPRTAEEIEATYGPRVEQPWPTAGYIMRYDGKPVGFMQDYLIRDYPEYASAIQVDDDAAGVDLFIGEEAYAHRGLGPVLLRAFLRTVVFARPEVGCCVIGPAASNHSAIRAYEKAGFRSLKTIQVPGEPEPEALLRITRKEVEASEQPTHTHF
jgi:RimJ/RimL family protein N-acetyltransferase